MSSFADVLVSRDQPAIVELQLPRRGVITGVVEDTTHDALLAGVKVRLMGEEGSLVGAAETDPTGAYRFEGLRAGPYRVQVESPRSYAAEATEVRVELSPGGFVEADFRLRVTGLVRGRIVDQDTGHPLPGVLVELYDSRGDLVRTGTTTAQGEYEFINLLEDRYTVLIAE